MRPLRSGRAAPALLACASACLAFACQDAPPEPPVHLERLSPRQIANTMTDLTGYRSPSLDALPGAEPGMELTMSVVDAEVIRSVATETAAVMAADLDRWAPCPAGETAHGCASRLLDRFGTLAWRGPVPPDVRDQMLDLFDAVAVQHGYPRGVEALLSAVLQSPRLVYRVEATVHEEGRARRLDDFAIASRLSYFLWDSAPDVRLLEAAARGELRREDGRVAEAERMLRDPRAVATFVARVRAWLGVDFISVTKDPAAFPAFDPASLVVMSDEIDAFARRAGWGDEGSFHRLITEPLDPADPRRRGILMLRGVLAALATSSSSSPVLRGKLVRERLLCESIAPPPAGLVIMAPEPSPETTTRERYEAHAKDEVCAACHTRLDPPGFAFEHYDAVGERRAIENGFVVDASGSLVASASQATYTFTDAADLLEQLDASGVAARCWARYFAEIAFGQKPDPEVMGGIEAELLEASTSTAALWRAIVRSPAFVEPIEAEEQSQ
jgi:hypothetical protein